MIVSKFALPLLVMAVPAAFLFSLSEATYRTAPQIAGALFPANAAAHEQEAQLGLRAAIVKTQDPAAAAPPQAAQAALAAYRRGPLVPDALQIIARDLGRRDKDLAFILLREANRLSRRSTAVNVDLLAAFAERRQETAGLEVLDQLLRRETAGQGQLLDAMTRLVANPAMHQPILVLLRNDPPWAAQFWRQLAQSPSGLTRAAALRMRAEENEIFVDPELDQLVIEGLAGQERFDEAATIASAVFPMQVRSASLVRNPRFKDLLTVLPFGWRLFNKGDYGASLIQAGDGLAVDALAGARGVAAEQLIRLPDSGLQLTALVDSNGGADYLTIELACAEGTHEILVESTGSGLPATISPSECVWAMLRIKVAVPSDAQPSEWLVREVELKPLT